MEEWSKTSTKNKFSLLEVRRIRRHYPQSPADLILLISGMLVCKLTTLTALSVPWDLVYITSSPGRGLLSGNMLRTSEMYPPKVHRAHFSSQYVYFFTARSRASEFSFMHPPGMWTASFWLFCPLALNQLLLCPGFSPFGGWAGGHISLLLLLVNF